MALNWRGNELKNKIVDCQKHGINKTMSESVIHAKNNHTWKNRTGTLEGSLNIHEYAKKVFNGVRGIWGSQDVRYALTHEFGDESRNIPARPYLRPAADATYSNLSRHIKECWNR